MRNVASSGSITTVAGKSGLESTVKKVPGGDIVFDSESRLRAALEAFKSSGKKAGGAAHGSHER